MSDSAAELPKLTAPKLLIISGPIASGTSTVANAIAAEFRASGRTSAVVDLDRVYMMLDDRSPMADPSIWREARRAAAALTDQFVLDGIELVIVEGTFWAQSERDEFTSRLSTPVHPVFVTLRVTVDEALRRVAADTGRRASRIPELLRASHAEFAVAPPIASDLTIDSTKATVEEAVHRFVDAGGALIVSPFDISIGRCAVVQDPWGNRLVVLDHSKGRLLTDAGRRVRLGADGSVQSQASQ